ncbi:unnamed protein product, partial [marine sediment metagenome]
IELRVDRDMEYVHLKDQRGSGTEPVNVLSGYDNFKHGYLSAVRRPIPMMVAIWSSVKPAK